MKSTEKPAIPITILTIIFNEIVRYARRCTVIASVVKRSKTILTSTTTQLLETKTKYAIRINNDSSLNSACHGRTFYGALIQEHLSRFGESGS